MFSETQFDLRINLQIPNLINKSELERVCDEKKGENTHLIFMAFALKPMRNSA